MKQPLNQVYYLSPDGKRHYFWYEGAGLLSHTNWGHPNIRFIEDSGPNQHGTTVRDWRAETRTISFEFWAHRQDCTCRDCALAEVIDIIRPNRSNTGQPGYLRVVTPRQVLREIPARVLRGPSGDYDYTGPIGKRQVRDVIQFYCNDPIWRNVEPIEIELPAEGSSTFDAGCMPFCLPSCIGSNVLAANVDIRYCGTWASDQITIRLQGPMEFPSILNATTGKEIGLQYQIAANETVIIEILPESATVTTENGINLIGTVTNISDLVSFTLIPRSDVAPEGINTLEISAINAVAGQTKIDIQYYVRHISAYGEGCDENCVEGVIT